MASIVRDSESPGLAPNISAAKVRIVSWSSVYSRSRVGRPIPCRLRVAACALDSGITGGGDSPSSPRIRRSKSRGKLLVRSASGKRHLISCVEKDFLPVLLTQGALEPLGLDPASALGLTPQ